MRILVIGGTTFIGSYVVTRLSDMGHEVTVFHRGQHEASLPKSVKHIHSASAGVPIVHFPDELKNAAPDLVLHMMAMGEQDAQAAMRAFRGIARRMVAVSSGDVYRAYGILNGTEAGPMEPVPLTEEAPLRQVLYPYRSLAKGPYDWVYHYEKILVERAVMGDPYLPGTILRLPAVYGPRDEHHRLFPYVKRMDDRRPAILLEEGQARWRFSHGYVENVAAAIVLALLDERAASRIYNVGEATTPTTAERIRQVGRVAGWNGEVVILARDRLPAHLQEAGNYNFNQDILMDSTRIREELGYREPVALDEALRRTLAWERTKAPGTIDATKFDYAAEDAALAGRD